MIAVALWSLALLPAQEPNQTIAAAAELPLILPEGQGATISAALRGGAVPAPTPKDLGTSGSLPGMSAGALRSEVAWKSFIESLALEAACHQTHATPDAERNARLALFALEQGRARQAWEHLALASSSPAWCAALLPRFLPGAPAGSPSGKDGFAGALPDGVVLHPLEPPTTRAIPSGRIERRRMSVRDLHVGGAVLALQVAVEFEGVQVEITHLSGSACKLGLLLPQDEQFGYSNEYVDWYVQETHGTPLLLKLEPGSGSHVIYGRFEARDSGLPGARVRRLPAALEQHGLALVVAADDPERDWLAGLARALTTKPLGLVCTLGQGDRGAIRFDLSDRARRGERIAWLAGAIEDFVLAPTLPR